MGSMNMACDSKGSHQGRKGYRQRNICFSQLTVTQIKPMTLMMTEQIATLLKTLQNVD